MNKRFRRFYQSDSVSSISYTTKGMITNYGEPLLNGKFLFKFQKGTLRRMDLSLYEITPYSLSHFDTYWDPEHSNVIFVTRFILRYRFYN